MTSISSLSHRKAWCRSLRNAATITRLKVLGCLKTPQCYAPIGVGAGGDTTKRFDQVAEQALVEYLQRFASFTLISEETGTNQVGASPIDYLVMDPIDGSTNLSHGISFACISVAFCTAPNFGSIEAAVIMELFQGTCYHAIRGLGAFKDSSPIQPAKAESRRGNLVVVDDVFPPTLSRPNLDREEHPPMQYIRHFGANALELCFVADGSIDGFIDLREKFRGTDLAAAALILNEAGAVLVNPHGEPISGECTNESRYSLIAARDMQFYRELQKRVYK